MKRIVIKVGKKVLTNTEDRIDVPVIRHLVQQLAQLYEQDVMSVVVSSGSMIAGKEILGELSLQDKSVRRQVFSAVGQPRLMQYYYSVFHDYGLRCAQVLATKRDFEPGRHRDNMINCYEGLLSEGITPIANEDDTVSLTNSMFSDNNEVASLVAELIQADLLIILTHTDGFYTGHPADASAELLSHIKVNENVEKYVPETEISVAKQRGGIKSKLKVAKYTAAKNIPTYMANGKRKNVVIDIVAGKNVGTRFSI
jgi:glutamate 5-kinase